MLWIGPIGQSFIWEEEYFQPLVLIGAGSGITPLLSIYNSYIKKYPNNKIVFIMSAKNKKRIMNYEVIKDFIVTRFTEEESRINLDFLKNNLNNLLSNKDVRFYISGPDNFVDDIVDFVTELGFPDSQIKSERFI
jgi:ferredoxin-NADP reductase